ncbi:MAG TPA: Imm1 family immunity protein [Pseudolabrys sp.]|nr:Imm1 family immunity protein [Pseudolabrys sp.]
MRQYAYFASRDFDGWPSLQEIEPYFRGIPGRSWFAPRRRWFNETGNDTAGFLIETAHPKQEDRITVELMLWGNLKYGVLLIWSMSGGGYAEHYASKGDLERLKEFVRTEHSDPNPIGLYVPFERAWEAVKEFLQDHGTRPQSIDWIATSELPDDVFPDQHDIPKDARLVR